MTIHCLGPSSRSVVFVSYNGLLDPLGPSQILPYVEGLRASFKMHLLTFERRDRLGDSAALSAMQDRVDATGIGWTRLRYHKWPSLPATTYDLVTGVLALRRILAGKDVALVHARGYLPTEIALSATRSHPVLFDIRGLQPEEYVDGGAWRKGELKWRLAKASERRFFRRAAGAVMLSETIQPYVAERFAELGRTPPLEVIPCCVDLERFRFRPEARERLRAHLEIAAGTVCFVYSGSIGTWYLAEEMARFVRGFRDGSGRAIMLLWMVNNDGEVARRVSLAAGLSEPEIRVVSARPSEVADYLSAADVGLALIKPSFSKRASSPTKYAESLAVGLPLVISRNVGDGARIADAGAAAALTRFDDQAMAEAAQQLSELLQRPRAHFRQVAETLFNLETVALPAYRRIYERLAR